MCVSLLLWDLLNLLTFTGLSPAINEHSVQKYGQTIFHKAHLDLYPWCLHIELYLEEFSTLIADFGLSID